MISSANLEQIVPGVSRETLGKLERFAAELRRWTQRINLVAPSTVERIWDRHILDSAQLFALAGPDWTRWVDLGSGGGLPGAVVGILASDAGKPVQLVESNSKKAAFLTTVLGGLASNVRVHRERIETAHALTGDSDIVSARALADLPGLLRLSEPWLRNGATGFFPKGRGYGEEIVAARDEWDFSVLEVESVTDAEGRILIVRDVRRRDKSHS